MLAGKTYCPILHTRAAEMKGLRRLPEPSKDLIFPLLVARPWPNANHLSKTWEKVEEAFGARRFALDLDTFKQFSDSSKPAAAEFRALFDPAEGHQAYFEQVAELPSAVPVLQLTGGDIPDLQAQVAHATALDRGLILRVQYGRCPHPNAVLAKVFDAWPEIVLLVDLGWAPDVLNRELWASGLLGTIDDPEREIVVAASSFPNSFKSKARDEIAVDERVIFDNLVRRHNAIRIIYGDWGSTRPPQDPMPMGGIPPRIDLPIGRQWVSFRKNGEEDFKKIATRVVKDNAWKQTPNIWGAYQIQVTAEGADGGISGQAAAAAVRVNIHLHRQAHFGSPVVIGEGDEPYTD